MGAHRNKRGKDGKQATILFGTPDSASAPGLEEAPDEEAEADADSGAGAGAEPEADAAADADADADSGADEDADADSGAEADAATEAVAEPDSDAAADGGADAAAEAAAAAAGADPDPVADAGAGAEPDAEAEADAAAADAAPDPVTDAGAGAGAESDAEADAATAADADPEPDADGAPHSVPSRTSRGTLVMDAPERASEPEPAPTSVGDPSPSRGGTVLMPPSARISEPRSRSRSSAAGAGPRPSAAGAGPRSSAAGSRPRTSRTTIFEVSAVAERLSTVHPKAEPSLGRQLKLSFAISLTLMLLLTMIFVGGAWRVVLGLLAGTGATTLAIWATLRSLPRMAKWLGPRELPGRPWMWLSGAFVVVSGVTVGLVLSLSAATQSLAVVGVPEVTPPEEPAEEPSAAPAKPMRADQFVKRDQHVKHGDGMLYAPPSFASPDGRFDLLVYYHGNVELVEQSVAATKLNALVYIVNYGEMSGRYARPLSNPDACDNLLNSVEERAAEALQLAQPRVERVALSSWSAGYGAVYHIIRSRSRLDRVDALLLMDSLHGHFAPGQKKGQETKLLGLRLKPFVTFGKRALAGEKLMVLTHSAVETRDYPSTTLSADDLLRRLGLPRSKANPESASPKPVEIDVAVKAFPSGERNWMTVQTEAHRGDFHLLGCSGKGKGDHIAHLAQMSVTVLPLLVTHWEAER